MRRHRSASHRPLKLSTSVILMVCAVIVSVLVVVYSLYFIQVSRIARDGVRHEALAVARTLADMPEVRLGLTEPPERQLIAPLTERVRQRNHLLFVVITDMRGVRYSHPVPDAIGKPFIGEDIGPALAGHENVSINHGVLAEALRVFTPVFDNHHRQIGVVAVGLSLAHANAQVARARSGVLWTVLFSVLVGGLGAWVLVRLLKRVLLGLEPYEISAQYEQRQAILQSLKEGVIAVDAQGQVTVINSAARQMLLAPGSGGVTASKDPLHAPLLASLKVVLHDGKPQQDREIVCNGQQLLSNTVPIRSQQQIIGAVCTFRDKTEVSQLLTRLDGMVNYVDALRAQTHEFMNKLHVILGLLNMRSYQKLEEYILQTAQNYQLDIGTLQRQIQSPVIAGFLLGKITRATEAGHRLTLDAECQLPDNPNAQQVATLITVLGNLIENALDAMRGQPEGEITLLLHYQQGWVSGEVSDDGPGISSGQIAHIFDKGFSTKGNNRGVGLYLARQQTESLGGALSVESEPGVYTQFFLQIPWDSERSQA